jgi:hypothetical protein
LESVSIIMAAAPADAMLKRDHRVVAVLSHRSSHEGAPASLSVSAIMAAADADGCSRKQLNEGNYVPKAAACVGRFSPSIADIIIGWARRRWLSNSR